VKTLRGKLREGNSWRTLLEENSWRKTPGGNAAKI